MALDAHDAVLVSAAEQATRGRDAARTRRLLLGAARRRFARVGYGATTSRDIAADAGVNVALINRYFGSKEGLFEACLERTAEELDGPDERVLAASDLIRTIIDQVARSTAPERPLQMLLLLRASGDERADEIRRRTLQTYTERMAALCGWRRDDPDSAPLLLNAQIAMALGFGIVAMRSSADLDPLSTASAEDLEQPLRSALTSLLPQLPDGR